MYRTFGNFILIELLVILLGLPEPLLAVTIVNQPLNAVVKLGSTVRFTCDLSETYPGYFLWRQLRFAGDPGRLIYEVYRKQYTNMSDFPAQKYMQVGDFGLQINSVNLDDSASYECEFATPRLSDAAGLTVIDAPPRLTTTATEMNVSSSAIFNCSVTFNAPYTATAGDQLPRLSLTVGGISAGTLVDNSSLASGARSLTQIFNYTAVASDADSVVQCTVSTTNPVYTNSSSFTLRILTPPQQLTISPQRTVCRVGDTLTCSAKGYPTPSISWQAVNTPSGDSILTGPILTVTSGMIGSNVFKCVAVNTLGSSELNSSFSVLAPTTAAVRTTTRSTTAVPPPVPGENQDGGGGGGGLSDGGKVGIGVGIGIGVPVIIAVILLAVFCSRRRAAQKNPSEPVRPPSYDNVARLPPNNYRQPPPPSSGLNSAASTSPPPEYNPRPARQKAGGPGPTPAVRLSRVGSENSGYADLGLSTIGADRAVPQRYEGQSNAPSMDRSFGRTEVGPKVAVVGPEKGHANYSYDQSPHQSPTKKKAPRVARKPEKPAKPVEMSGEPVNGMPVKEGKHSGDMDPTGRTGSPVFVVDDWPAKGSNANQNIPKVTMNLDRSFEGERSNRNIPPKVTMNLDRSFEGERSNRNIPPKVTMNLDRSFEGERLPSHDGVTRPMPRPRSRGSDGGEIGEKHRVPVTADEPTGWPSSRRARKSGSFDEPEISIPVVEFTPPRAGNRSFDGIAEPKVSVPNAMLDRRIGDTSFEGQVGGPAFNVPSRGPAYNNNQNRGDGFADGMPAVQKVEPFTRRGDRSFEGIADPSVVAPRMREPYNPMGDRSFEGFVEPPSAAVRKIEPVSRRSDGSFDSLRDPIGPMDPYASRGDRLQGPVPASRFGDPYPRMDRSFDGLRDPKFSAAPAYNLESYPTRNNRSFDNLHDTIGSVGSTAPLVRGSRENLNDSTGLGHVGPAGYPAARAGAEFSNDGRLRAADRSFDDNLSFTVGSPRGSQQNIQGQPVIQFKNASKSVDV